MKVKTILSAIFVLFLFGLLVFVSCGGGTDEGTAPTLTAEPGWRPQNPTPEIVGTAMGNPATPLMATPTPTMVWDCQFYVWSYSGEARIWVESRSSITVIDNYQMEFRLESDSDNCYRGYIDIPQQLYDPTLDDSISFTIESGVEKREITVSTLIVVAP